MDRRTTEEELLEDLRARGIARRIPTYDTAGDPCQVCMEPIPENDQTTLNLGLPDYCSLACPIRSCRRDRRRLIADNGYCSSSVPGIRMASTSLRTRPRGRRYVQRIHVIEMATVSHEDIAHLNYRKRTLYRGEMDSLLSGPELLLRGWRRTGMYHSILVATDDSPMAKTAVDRAIELADRFDASLYALYVVNERLGRTTATKDPYEQAGNSALKAAEAKAAERNLQITTDLIEGRPANAILEYAEDHHIDLIVLGGKDKSAAERFFIGNTAEKVVRHAPVSVLVVREEM